MNILHVVKSEDDIDDNLKKLVEIQARSLKHDVSILKPKKALFAATVKKLFRKQFDAIHVHFGTNKFKKLSKVVINQSISDFFSKREFYAETELQLFLNKEILFSYSEGNPKLVISVIESIKYLSSEYTLRIINKIKDDDLTSFKEIIENLNLSHRVSFGLSNEDVTPKMLSRAYKEASLILFNSIGINIKTEITKALACGIPVIAFSNEEYLEIKGLYFSGLLGPKALAKKMREIVEENNWVDTETVYERFSLESLALSLDKKYQGLNKN